MPSDVSLVQSHPPAVRERVILRHPSSMGAADVGGSDSQSQAQQCDRPNV